ncbi:MAG: amino acid ABC transporter substrate-binding protein [Solirubrobacterales bacterium 67-14]|nr:MAG: amino acid ABC transporter substrate-binding protein [Solirubrobacterales bacterium 67-14]
MHVSRNRLVLFLIAIFALAVFVGCGSSDDSSDDNSSSGDTTTTASDCTPEGMNTFKDGVLTIGTDSPAYPPYFEDDDPSNGKGFESALGYAIADELGFNNSQVEWATVPFNASYAPGEKKFDFDLNQISITPAREKAVTFSVPYYTANQAVLVKKGSDLDGITSLDQLKDAAIGVQIGTTSYEAVNDQIQPDTTPKTFNNSNDVVTAFKQGQVDAIVVDLPTALYLSATELPDAVVAGQFEQEGGAQWGALMAKDSDLEECVDKAITALKDDGTLEEITNQWMSDSAKAPMLN